MKTDKKLKERIENYVRDWHWDEKSKIYAFKLGKFLFSFIDYLEDQKLSNKTKSIHTNNLTIIGNFELSYGHNDSFRPENLQDGPHFLYGFSRKVRETKYATQSYESTWRKIDKYIKSGGYTKYLNRINENLVQET